MSDQQERRRDIRARITLPVSVVRRGGVEPVQMVDASFRGLFLRMKKAVPLRELVMLRVRLPAREIVLYVVSVRVVDEPGGQSGVGFRFFALNGQDRVDWETFIAKAVGTRGLHAA